MNRNLPENIEDLADKNIELMRRIGFSERDNPAELCSPESYRLTGLFTEDMIRQMFFGEDPQPPVQTEEQSSTKALILIRPDMMHARNEFSTFIRDRFKMLLEQEVEMDSQTYWTIYQYDRYSRESMHCRLTRAAISIGSTCCVMLFEDVSTGSKNFADVFFETYKGKQGIYNPQTLRGGIVYAKAITLGLHDAISSQVNKRLWYAADPFGAYRESAANNVYCQTLTYPLLFYTGVGVHVPDGIEIRTDMPALLESLK